MSQKTTRRTTQMQTTIVSSDTPNAEMVANARSPFSPTCLSRQDEKNKLQHLNDRLAQYIDRVRSLEVENQRLGMMIRSSDEKLERTCSGIKSTYNKELMDAKRIADEMAHEKTKLSMELDKKTAAFDELKSEHDILAAKFNDSQKSVEHLETTVTKLERNLSDGVAKLKNLMAENKKLKDENKVLGDQVKKMQAALDKESLKNFDLKNEVNSLRDQLTLEKSVHDEELTAVRNTREVVFTEINEQLDTEYKQRMQDELATIRQDFEAQIRQSRIELENMYEKKLADIRLTADDHLGKKHFVEGELKRIQNQLVTAESDRNKLAADLEEAKKALQEAEKKAQKKSDELYGRLNAKDAEIEALRSEIEQMMIEYKDLMGLKVTMTAEIDAYRHLLEGEEKRLNLSPTSESDDSSSPRRPTKRRRLWYSTGEASQEAVTTTEADSKGDLIISDHDATTGKYVTVKNKATEDINLGGWILSRKAGRAEVYYKFHPKIILKGEKQVTIWSSDSKAEHHPPNDLVMKNQKWPCGNKVLSKLVNSDGEEVAWRETVLEMHPQAHENGGSCSVM